MFSLQGFESQSWLFIFQSHAPSCSSLILLHIPVHTAQHHLTALSEYFLLFSQNPFFHFSLGFNFKKRHSWLEFPPQLAERINTPFVFCLLPCLSPCIPTISLGFCLGVFLSITAGLSSLTLCSTSWSFLTLQSLPSPPFCWTLAKILAVTSRLRDFTCKERSIVHFNMAFTTWARIYKVMHSTQTERFCRQEDSNHGGSK